jgi:MAF protein
MLNWLGITFRITQTETDETPRPGENPAALAARLARRKAAAAQAAQPGALILTADTVVDLDGRSLGKPADAAEAQQMLAQLREAEHRVHSGVALTGPEIGPKIGPGAAPRVRRVTTEVRMRPYTDREIAAYVATGDPMDKAGAYAIQHRAFAPVERVNVCYANVVGLPLCAVARLLRTAGWPVAVDIPQLCYLHFGYACPNPDEGVRVEDEGR